MSVEILIGYVLLRDEILAAVEYFDLPVLRNAVDRAGLFEVLPLEVLLVLHLLQLKLQLVPLLLVEVGVVLLTPHVVQDAFRVDHVLHEPLTELVLLGKHGLLLVLFPLLGFRVFVQRF